MKRMTRVINEDRKTGRPRFRFRFQRSSVVGDVRLWKNLWCVTRRERERGGEQLVASSHVSSRTGEISNYRGNLFFFPSIFWICHWKTPRLLSLVDLRLSLNSVSQIDILFDINFYADWKYIVTIWKKKWE